jgi:hypothetical protein
MAPTLLYLSQFIEYHSDHSGTASKPRKTAKNYRYGRMSDRSSIIAAPAIKQRGRIMDFRQPWTGEHGSRSNHREITVALPHRYPCRSIVTVAADKLLISHASFGLTV